VRSSWFVVIAQSSVTAVVEGNDQRLTYVDSTLTLLTSRSDVCIEYILKLQQVDDIGPRHGIDGVADIEKNGKDAYVLYKPDGVVAR